MIGITVPTRVVAGYLRLEKAAGESTRARMEYVWHWTLDETNDQRVKITAFAKAVGRSHNVISKDAHGFELLRSGLATTPSEAIEKAGMSTEKYAAIDAVAQAHSKNGKPMNPVNVRQHHKEEVEEVRTRARRNAEIKGTTIHEELPNAAKDVIRGREVDAEERDRKRRIFGSTYMAADGYLTQAQRAMFRAIDSVTHGKMSTEEWELLTHDLDKVIELANLAKAAQRPTGQWTKKLEVLKGGLSA